MTKVIGRFIPTGAPDYRQPFNVVTMEPSKYLAPAWQGKREDGKEYHVIERAWKFEPAWSGDGLPSVGIECEFLSGLLAKTGGDDNKPKDGQVVKIVSHEKYHNTENEVVVATWYGDSGGMRASVFSPRCLRPIRSERDKAIETLASIICGDVPDTGMATALMYATRIYDAGYRKLSD